MFRNVLLMLAVVSFAFLGCSRSTSVPDPLDSEESLTKTDLSFKQWLFEYIPTQYPDAKMTDHTYWLQSHITEDLVVNWTEWTDADSTLNAMEGHNLIAGKAMFIEQKGPKNNDMANHPAVTYYEGAGYYISGYDPATMGSWDGKGLSVIQFDGDSKQLVEKIAMAWAKKKSFEGWLYTYLPAKYPNAKMTDHGKWKQAHITEHIVASWEQWNFKDIKLQDLEKESLDQGKAFFIEQKGPKKDWANHPAVTHFKNAGYYCSGYDQATMRDWGVEGLTVIQFNGDCKDLSATIAKAWAQAK